MPFTDIMKPPLSTYFRKGLWMSAGLFVMMNLIAFVHAWKFTHFSSNEIERTPDPKDLTWVNKFEILFTGIDNPKPKHKAVPNKNFNIIKFHHTGISGWYFQTDNAKGTVILFHGYAGEKSSLLTRAYQFNALGYNTLLVDFSGSGDSEGKSTSIGFHESDQVLECYNYIQSKREKNIFLFGTSMGAAAILKSINDYHISPKGILLECPFGSLYNTVCARFHNMNLPCFPMAGLLTFWGGVQQGYWAFDHNPSEYAKSVTCPALLMFGELDDRVTRNETDEIFSGFKSFKILKTYPRNGHDIFTTENECDWQNDVSTFLSFIECQ